MSQRTQRLSVSRPSGGSSITALIGFRGLSSSAGVTCSNLVFVMAFSLLALLRNDTSADAYATAARGKPCRATWLLRLGPDHREVHADLQLESLPVHEAVELARGVVAERPRVELLGLGEECLLADSGRPLGDGRAILDGDAQRLRVVQELLGGQGAGGLGDGRRGRHGLSPWALCPCWLRCTTCTDCVYSCATPSAARGS